jgi:hypothetical protein
MERQKSFDRIGLAGLKNVYNDRIGGWRAFVQSWNGLFHSTRVDSELHSIIPIE